MLDVITEKTDRFTRDIVETAATGPGKMTLFTASFARGTDFKSDKEVLPEGVLVIQTFFSKEISEEVQAKGRTARQGQNGIYKLVLCKETLMV